MNININCIYNDKGAWCKNENVPKSFFGIGSRCCKEFNGCEKCEFKEEHTRAKAPPPPPKPLKIRGE
jgi:hypothetical protein